MNIMNITKYEAFIKVAELGNITHAAQALGYSQPGISHMLNSLEQELGLQLLYRNKDSLRLTENGKEILSYCRQIVRIEHELQGTVAAINGCLTGTIHIGALNSTLRRFVPKVVSKFSNIYSGIKLTLSEYSFANIEKTLINDIIDLAFTSKIPTDKMEFRSLFEDPYCLVVNLEHPLASYESISPPQLNGLDFIMPLPGSDEIVQDIMMQKNFSPHIVHYTESDTAAVAMVGENLGVYITSNLQTDFLPPNVVALGFNEHYYRTIGIALRSFKYASPAIKEFVKVTEHTVKKLNIADL